MICFEDFSFHFDYEMKSYSLSNGWIDDGQTGTSGI